MGNGSFSNKAYQRRSSTLRDQGYTTNFAHTEDIRAGRKAASIVNKLDPLSKNKKGPFADTNLREAADNEDHPESTPIVVMFDVTGSMGRQPMVLQQKLPALHDILQNKGYVSDPQMLFGAIGDAQWDRFPLQVGQFESDNRADEDLSNIFIESGGGGGGQESYELAIWWIANHTRLESMVKRGKKGYFFTMGDEMPYDFVGRNYRHEMSEFTDQPFEPVSVQQAIQKVQTQYEYFHFFVADGGYREEKIMPRWKELLGERAIVLPSSEGVAEAIAAVIGLCEGRTATQMKQDMGNTQEANQAVALIGGSTAVTRF